MSTSKSFILDVLRIFVLPVFSIFATLYITSQTELEYRSGTQAPYFKFPEVVASDLKIFHKGKEMENISIVEYAIHNRTFSDQENVKIYVKLKDNKKHNLISKKLVPPAKIPDLGIVDEKTPSENLIGFNVALLQTTGEDYYHLSLVFEGSEVPETEISTGNKNIKIVEYKKWKNNSIAIIVLAVLYFACAIPIALLMVRSDTRKENKFIKRFKDALTSVNSLLNEDQANFAVAKYQEVKKVKNQVWKSLIAALTKKNPD